MHRGLVLIDIEHTAAASPALAARERFEQWMELYQGRVARLAQRLLGWRADVDDVVQDVFLSVLHHAGDFRGESSPWTWLAAITINQCRQRMRRKALWRRLGLAGWLEKKQASPPPETALLDNEIHQRVRASVAALPSKEREVVVLYYLEQFSTAEIGGMLKLTISAVDVRLHRARAKMKLDLAELMKD